MNSKSVNRRLAIQMKRDKPVGKQVKPGTRPAYCPDYYTSDLHVVAECKACQRLMEEPGYGHGV